MDSDTAVALGGGHKQHSERALNKIIFLLDNWDVLSRDRVRKFGTSILKGIKGFTRAKTN